jgi:hypothetical protein
MTKLSSHNAMEVEIGAVVQMEEVIVVRTVEGVAEAALVAELTMADEEETIVTSLTRRIQSNKPRMKSLRIM